jgi:carboxymethylenebutenolidase
MCDDDIDPGFEDPSLSRRTFGAATAATAVAGFATAASAQTRKVVEKDVTIKTPDGTADAALFYPEGRGTWPGVLMWPDIMTLRPVFRDMGRRLAAEGYVVLVPNYYYRTQKAPISLNFSNQADRPAFTAMRAPLTADANEKDTKAYIAFIDAQPQTNKKKKIGTQGYCMGGPYAFNTATQFPSRVGAVASFHGGGLTTTAPTSPHNGVAKANAQYLVAVARNDDRTDPKSKETLKETFASTKRPGMVEVYNADHGWMVRGSAVYDAAEAERGWANMLSLYQRALA